MTTPPGGISSHVSSERIRSIEVAANGAKIGTRRSSNSASGSGARAWRSSARNCSQLMASHDRNQETRNDERPTDPEPLDEQAAANRSDRQREHRHALEHPEHASQDGLGCDPLQQRPPGHARDAGSRRRWPRTG